MCESGSLDVVRVGLIGCGTVGAAFAEALQARQTAIAARYGLWIELCDVAVAHPDRRRLALEGRGVSVHGDGAKLADDRRLDIVVEASTAGDAAAWLKAALGRGAAVVTANKAAIAGDRALLDALVAPISWIWCEAAVGGAVPIVRGVRESLAGNDVLNIRGLFNGTTTYVLSRLEEGASLEQAVDAAQRAGYAEADPTADLSGADAAAKLAILATLAWGQPVSSDAVITRGVDSRTIGSFADLLRRRDGRAARVRVVASAARSEATGIVRGFVSPAVIAFGDALHATQGVENVIEIETQLAGTLTWRGAGAGGAATASALLADTIAAARALVRGGRALARDGRDGVDSWRE
jgi:homoserine dehydrogenase